MEEAPKPTFQDELEWCIAQLETGLLRLNPTPKQADETQRILRVLRSRKAPLVKKRQVMHHVFGDYRLKMAEEKERAAKAAVRPEKVEIQQGNVLPSGSVVYRKQSGCPSAASTSLLASSDNSFQFNFVLPERTPEETDRITAEEQGLDDSREQSTGNGPSGMLDFSTGAQKPDFAFNFIIPDVPSLSAVAIDSGAEAAPEIDIPSKTAERSTFSKPDRTDVMDCAGRQGEACPRQEAPKLETAQVAPTEVTKEKLVVAAGGPSKRRKKKKLPPSKIANTDKGNGDNKPCGQGTSDQAEMLQPDDQLKREIDWCVEQLELGLKTQKSTPKQMEEAVRAIKTLRSKKAVLAKKRQVMRIMFGDYRAKMAEERQKQLKLLQAASKAAHIAEVTEEAQKKRSQVFRKSAEGARRGQNLQESFLQPPAPSKPEDEVKKKTEAQSPSTSTSQFISSAGRALEYTEEELEASLQKLTSLFFSTDAQKKPPHSDHRAPLHQRESAGKEPQEKAYHPTAQQNILDEIEQAVQETADTEVYMRRRPQQPVPRRHEEENLGPLTNSRVPAAD